jgi:hypothetical protein
MWKAPTKHRTAETELAACLFLLREGYEVFRNISACGTADLIACKGDKVLRIDVKSGSAPKLTPEQESEGVVILHVDEHGHCEFGADRKRRVAKDMHAVLTEIAGMPPKEGAEQLKQRGLTTPNGAPWSPGLVVQMRQRLALAG